MTHTMGSTTKITDVSDTAAWNVTNGIEKYNLVSVDSKLYIEDVYRRDGNGTGLNGTWIKLIYEKKSSGTIKQHKSIITISGSTAAWIVYEKEDNGDWVSEGSYNYSLTKTSIKDIVKNESVSYILAGDYLIVTTGYDSQ